MHTSHHIGSRARAIEKVGIREYATHSLVTEQFKRLTDAEWSQQIGAGALPELPWLRDLIVR